MSSRLALIAASLLAGSCAFVPQPNASLEAALREYQAAAQDPQVSHLAAAELEAARQTIDRAARAKDTLQDVADVDHLAYLARQRVAISREAAALRSARGAP